MSFWKSLVTRGVIASGATLLSPMKPLPLGQVVSTGAAARGVDSTEHRPRRAARSEPCSILRRPTIGSRSPLGKARPGGSRHLQPADWQPAALRSTA